MKNLKFLGADGQILTAGKSGKIPPGQVSGTGNISEAFRYFYHPDHLGSTSYVTDATGEVYQHLEYFAFGETFVEEHSNTERTPYLFNGRELDEETGLYYYGARYYDPRTSIFQSIDPLAEKYTYQSPFTYAGNNPVRFSDLFGMGPSDETEPSTHTIQNKDTYYGLANRTYKDRGITVDNLREWNPGVDENKLKVGQKINISDPNKKADNTPKAEDCPNCALATYIRETPFLSYGANPTPNPFYKAEAIYGDAGLMLAGAEVDWGKFFILVGPDKGKAISYTEIAGGAAPEMGGGVEVGRIDFTGDISTFNRSYLEGFRHKVWAGISGEVFGGGVGVSWSYIEGAGYIIGTSLQGGSGLSTPISAGYNKGEVKLEK